MRKLIAAINMTIDGVADHTGMTPDEEVHDHYARLIDNAGVLLYGRITYQLMQFWQGLIKNPSDEKSMNDFAASIDKVPKIVFSNTLTSVDWESAKLATRHLKEEVLALKQQPGKDILVGSRSLIMQLIKLELVDEFQLCVHPVIAGNGMQLFESITDRTNFRLIKAKTFNGGAVMFYYEPLYNV